MCCGRCRGTAHGMRDLMHDLMRDRDALRRPVRMGAPDRGIDAAIDLERVFGPNIGYRSEGRHWRRNLRHHRPPPIGFGEIRTSAGQDGGALELLTRFAELRRRHPGRPLPLGGLVTTTPTGLVRYTVADPNRDRIVWQGNLARLPWINRVGPGERERAVRALLRRITGQGFANLPYPHPGADLIPTPAIVRADAFDDMEDELDAAALDEDALDDLLDSMFGGLDAWDVRSRGVGPRTVHASRPCGRRRPPEAQV